MSPTHSINHKSWFYSQMQTHCGLPLFFHSCSFLLTPCRAQYPLKTQWQGWCCCILVNLTLLRRGQIQLLDFSKEVPRDYVHQIPESYWPHFFRRSCIQSFQTCTACFFLPKVHKQDCTAGLFKMFLPHANICLPVLIPSLPLLSHPLLPVKSTDRLSLAISSHPTRFQLQHIVLHILCHLERDFIIRHIFASSPLSVFRSHSSTTLSTPQSTSLFTVLSHSTTRNVTLLFTLLPTHYTDRQTFISGTVAIHL